jgi:filamentous hemagglutinin family protein
LQQQINSFFVAVGLAVLASSSFANPPTGEPCPIELDGSIGPGGDVPFNLGTHTWEISDHLGEYNNSGTSLFHSFLRFNVPGTDIAEFSSLNGAPERVFARVWGEASQIDGTLRSTAVGPTGMGADLYILNPAGVTFGANSTVDVKGSFYATSADRVDFENGSFHANPAQELAKPIVFVGDPTRFGFLSSPANVTFRPRGRGSLSVPEGETFAAIGGNVTLSRGLVRTFDSPGSRIALIAAGPGVDVDFDLSSYDPSTFEQPLGEVRIDGTQVLAAGTVGGTILVRGGSFVLRNGARLTNVHSTNDPPAFARAIDVSVRDALVLESGASIKAGTNGSAPGGEIWLQGDAVRLSDAVVISSTTGDGEGSNIVVRANLLTLENSGGLIAETAGSGDSGSIAVRGTRVEIEGSVIEVRALDNSTGAGGQLQPDGTTLGVSIDSDVLIVSNDSLVGTITQGLGRAGDLLLIARKGMRVEGGPLGQSSVRSTAKPKSNTDPTVGASGRVLIETGQLELIAGGRVTTSTTGTGDAGIVEIHAKNVEISGRVAGNSSGLFAQTLSGPTVEGGDGGAIFVTVEGDFALRDGATVDAQTAGQGNAGDIDIVAGREITLDRGASITTFAAGRARGRSGSIRLEAGRGIALSGDSLIEARSAGTGAAGSIDILAGQQLDLVDSTISTVSSRADGGVITITASDRVSLTDSGVNTSVALSGTDGDGGDIRIDPDVVSLNRSQILARARLGQGGNILIRAGAFVESSGSVIDASSDEGIDGVIVIESPESDLVAEATQIAQNYLDAAGLMKTACGAQGAELSSLVVTRVAGLPATPEGPLPSRLFDDTWLDTDTIGKAAPRPTQLAAARSGCSNKEAIQ